MIVTQSKKRPKRGQLYYGHTMQNRLVTKYSKLKLYRTVVTPIMTYAPETRVLKETIIQKLLVFERKFLRRIFRPTKEKQIWRIKTNEELDKLIKHKNSQSCKSSKTKLVWSRTKNARYPNS